VRSPSPMVGTERVRKRYIGMRTVSAAQCGPTLERFRAAIGSSTELHAHEKVGAVWRRWRSFSCKQAFCVRTQ
jgi:hypothetical protein